MITRLLASTRRSPLWGATLGPTEFKIVAYFYYIAASTPDGRITKTIQEIAEATGLAWRTVQSVLQELNRDERRVIRILSKNKEKTLIEIPPEHWPSPADNPEPVVEQAVNPELAVPPPASIPELIYRLCGQRPTPELLAVMKAAADNDEQRLQHCLDFLFRQGSRWATLELLTVAVQDDLGPRDYFDQRWAAHNSRP